MPWGPAMQVSAIASSPWCFLTIVTFLFSLVLADSALKCDVKESLHRYSFHNQEKFSHVRLYSKADVANVAIPCSSICNTVVIPGNMKDLKK